MSLMDKMAKMIDEIIKSYAPKSVQEQPAFAEREQSVKLDKWGAPKSRG